MHQVEGKQNRAVLTHADMAASTKEISLLLCQLPAHLPFCRFNFSCSRFGFQSVCLTLTISGLGRIAEYLAGRVQLRPTSFDSHGLAYHWSINLRESGGTYF